MLCIGSDDSSFNPRARVGRDLQVVSKRNERSMFQSTRPRGARRQTVDLDIVFDEVSIHAPAWGATGSLIVRRVRDNCFNPRARVGRDSNLF